MEVVCPHSQGVKLVPGTKTCNTAPCTVYCNHSSCALDVVLEARLGKFESGMGVSHLHLSCKSNRVD